MIPLSALRQSAAELLAFVALDLFPGCLLVEAISTEFGFYCDLIASQPIDDYAIPLLEEKMRKLIKEEIEVGSLDMMREVAARYLEHHGQPLRAQEVECARENIVSLMQIGTFCDYCPLPYMATTRDVEFFKIFSVECLASGNAEEVKRIYGTVAADKQTLKQMVKAWQLGKKASHASLPKQRKLFSFHENISDLAWVWEQKGIELKRTLARWWEREHVRSGFDLVETPPFIKESLAKKAGIQEAMPTIDIADTTYVVPPTCTPSHMALFAETTRSEKEMPIRYAECTHAVYRHSNHDLWGVLNSNLQSADLAHIFCAPNHLEKELISSLQFIDKTIKMFGFEYYWHFVGRGEKFAGSEYRWDKAVASLESAFQQCGWTYNVDPAESSHSGPLVEARLTDRFGREWKGPSLGIDFYSPEKLGLFYQGADHKKHAPIMIVRSLFGSLERFAALLIEQAQGTLPPEVYSD